MEILYKSLTSKNLSSLITIIKVTTVLGYIGISISLVGFSLSLFSINILNTNLLVPSVLLLFLAGFCAVLVSIEDAYRSNIERNKTND